MVFFEPRSILKGFTQYLAALNRLFTASRLVSHYA